MFFVRTRVRDVHLGAAFSFLVGPLGDVSINIRHANEGSANEGSIRLLHWGKGARCSFRGCFLLFYGPFG